MKMKTKISKRILAVFLTAVMLLSAVPLTSLAADHEHEFVEIKRTEATCTAAGEIVRKCKLCSTTQTQIFPAMGHKWATEKSVVKEATCTEEGYKAIVCTVCKAEKEGTNTVDEMNPNNHINIESLGEDIAPTCCEMGYDSGKRCKDCGIIVSQPQEISATGHDWGVWLYPKGYDCSKGGVATHVCKTCKQSETRTISAGVHNEIIDDAAVEATCTAEGKTAGKRCGVCGVKIIPQETIPAKGHDNGEVICNKDATHSFKCKRCNESFGTTACTDADSNCKCDVCGYAYNHLFLYYVSNGDATCKADGTETATCTVCGETDTRTAVDSHLTGAHNYDEGEWILPDDYDCTLGGIKKIFCKRCGAVTKEEVIAAKPHEEKVDMAVAATCTTDGKTRGSHCGICGKTIVPQETIFATGHKCGININIVKPTCTMDGYTEYECILCHKVYSDNIIKAHHTDNDGDHICEVCGQLTKPYIAQGNCGENDDNVTFVLYEDGDLVISGEGKMADFSDSSTTPWNSYSSQIKFVTIRDGVTSIGNSAFSGCTNLASVTIGNGVTSIGDYAFLNCSNLTRVEFSVTYYCGSNIGPDDISELASKINSAYEATIKKHKSLSRVTIPENVTSIGTQAFGYCYSTRCIKVTLTPYYISEQMEDSDYIKIPDFKIYCHSNSAGEKYAIDNGFDFETFDSHVHSYDEASYIWSADYSQCTAELRCPCGYNQSETVNTVFNVLQKRSCTQPEIMTFTATFKKQGFSEQIKENIKTADKTGHTDEDSDYICEVCGQPTRKIISSGNCGVNGDNVTFILYDDGDLVISGTGDMRDYDSRSFVPQWNQYRSKIKNVTIRDGVTSVGSYSFNQCTSLTNLIIGNSVTSIGSDAFKDCDRLTSVAIPDSVTSIGYEAFYSCNSLTSVTIGNSVTSIGNYAFSNCFRITSIVIPDSVTSIGDYAFNDCDGLTDVIIPDGVTSIGNYAFRSCNGLTNVTIGNGVTSIGDDAFYDCDRLTRVTIGNSVTSIGSYAFYSCNSLASIIVPDSVKSIGYCAFYNCYNLKNVIIGDGVTSIGDEAFYNCNSLTSVTIGNSVTIIGSFAFYSCDRLANIIVPDSVKSIGNYAFYYCYNLKNVTIGNGVTSIGSSAFQYCHALTSVTIGNSVENIGYSAFYNCSNLTDVYYRNGEAQWNEIAIGSNNNSLLNAKIHFCDHNYTKTVAAVAETCTTDGYTEGVYCKDCDSYLSGHKLIKAHHTDEDGDCICDICHQHYRNVLKQGNCGADGDNVTFKLYDDGELVISGTGDMSDFDSNSSVPQWNLYRSRIKNVKIRDGVTSVGSYSFYNYENLTGVTIPDSVTSIGKSAFAYCTGLTKAIIGNGVTSIGNYAFRDCDRLTSVVIPDGVTSIGYKSFYSCNSLTSVTIGNSVTSIGNYAFSNCFRITSIVIPDSVTRIGHYAFNDCDGLTSVIIPDSVTRIGNYAFRSCNGLTNVIIGNSVKRIGSYAFDSCKNLTNVTIGNSVTSIGSSAFNNCYNLTKVKIGNAVTSIGDYAFYGCNSLTSVIIPDSVKSIGDSAFYNCKGLTRVTIGNSVANIGYRAFYICSNLNDVYYRGDEAHWNEIEIGLYNNSLFNATFHFCDHNNTEAVDAVAETCTTNGYTVGVRCTDCGSFVSGHELIKAHHTDNDNDYLCDICAKTTKRIIAQDNCGENEDNVTFVLYKDGELVISGEGTMADYSDLSTVPWNSYIAKIKAVTIRNGVTSIGDYAFSNCSRLTRVTIPDSVTSVGGSAFNNCDRLINITIPNSVTSLGDRSFNSCNRLTSVTIGNGVTSIGDYAFYNCRRLKDIAIPDGVTNIGKDAFYNCDGLTSITIPHSVTSIVYESFYGCNNLTSVTIPDSVTSIGDYAFNGCKSLTSVTIPDSVTSIGDGTFGYSGLESITIPGTVASMGKEVFSNSGLKIVTICNGVSSVEEGMFIDCTDLSDVTIPDSVTSIGAGAFYNCANLETITIPDKVTSIDDNAFYNCTKMKSVTIPKSVTEIGAFAFGFYSRYGYSRIKNFKIYCYSDSKGLKYALNNEFKYELLDDPTSHTHTLKTDEVAPTCTADGYKKTYCTECKTVISNEVLLATGNHIDNDNDEKCDTCGVDLRPVDPTQGCDCRCHKGGFQGFIYKIVLIFWKLFKTNQICKCGVSHY